MTTTTTATLAAVPAGLAELTAQLATTVQDPVRLYRDMQHYLRNFVDEGFMKAPHLKWYGMDGNILLFALLLLLLCANVCAWRFNERHLVRWHRLKLE